MNKLLTLSLSTVFAVSVLVGVAVILPKSATAADIAPAPKTSTNATPSTTTSAEKTFNYVAQPDDTYSQMARKAIQTYGVNNKVKLSRAQIIAAETNITIQAGSPILALGQKIAIKESVVKDWTSKVQKLTPAQESAWNMYTAGVNFNTNAIGQSK